MIPRKNIILIAVLLCLYGVYKLIYPTGSFNYRMTLKVETPEGIKTGSAVREVHMWREPKIFPEQPAGHAGVKGEAVVVDLGERGVLFGLLKSKSSSGHGKNIVFRTFPTDFGALSERGVRHYSSLKGKKNLTYDTLPMLVRFRDLNDPKTVELVDPRNLAASFGEGVKLKFATIEITDDAVTTGVERYISKKSWKAHGFAEWRAKLRYDQVIIDWEDFKKGTK